MPSIKSIRAFILTMEQGSLTLAAQEMNLSQPAASRLLQQLEEEFGSALFFRDKKTLIPSPQAELLYPELSRILSTYSEVPNILGALQHNETLPFKVMAQTRCTLGLVVPALARLGKKWPDLKIDLATNKRTELRRRMISDRFDVGVFALPLHIDFAEVVSVTPMTCRVVVSKNSPLAKLKSVTLEDLQAQDYISVKEALTGKKAIENILAKSGDKLSIKHEVSNAYVGLSLVRQGLGYMVAERSTIDPAYLSDIRLLPLENAPAIDYAICVSKDMREHPAKADFIQILTDILQEYSA